MKFDIMFLVSARMGFRYPIKIFHYSLFLKKILIKILLQRTAVATQIVWSRSGADLIHVKHVKQLR